MIREVATAAVFLGVLLGALVGAELKCLDGTFSRPCPEERPPVCLAWYPNDSLRPTECLDVGVRPGVDPVYDMQEFNRTKWHRYPNFKK